MKIVPSIIPLIFVSYTNKKKRGCKIPLFFIKKYQSILIRFSIVKNKLNIDKIRKEAVDFFLGRLCSKIWIL